MTDDQQSARTIPAPPKFNAPSTTTTDDPNISKNNAAPDNDALNSEKPRTAAPPPPKFNAAPLPPPSLHQSRPASDPAKAAAIAAAKAAQHVTPAQRDRMIMEAAAHALAQRTELAAADENNANKETTTAAVPSAPLGPYQPPSWASKPPTIPYSIEIMKQGTIISTLDLQQLCRDAKKGYLTLGRAPNNDILLDHPSSSRLHAVLEFRTKKEESHEHGGEGHDAQAEDEEKKESQNGVIPPGIYLYDPGSTHGCYVNKARIAAGQHVPLNIGDMLRFGESTRIMILCGPSELMAEEGLSREQRKQAAALEALKRRKEKDAAAAKLAMAKAIAAGGGSGGGGGGVDWGFGEDACGDSDEENDADKDEIDWREHAANKGLSEKQQKMADKIRKREARILQLQKESEKIQLKQRSMEEMSVGQANTLGRNEQEIEKAMIEIEELEDQLIASIEDSISGKKKSQGAGKSKKKGKKRRRAGSDNDSEDGGGDSDEDLFYDRTGARARRTKSGGGFAGGGGGRSGRGGGGEQVVEDAASLYGALEALKEEKERVEALLHAETKDRVIKNQQQGAVDEKIKSNNGAAASASAPAAVDVDTLDDYMSAVEYTIESDREASLRKELAQIESKLTSTARLLKIADPDGYFKPGSKAAELAVQRARKAVHIEKQRKEAEERQEKEALAAKMAAEVAFIEEKEEEEETEKNAHSALPVHPPAAVAVDIKQSSTIHELPSEEQVPASFGLQIQTKKDTPNHAAQQQQPPQNQDEPSAYEKRRAGIAASLQALKSPHTNPQNAPSLTATTDAATAQVLADLAVLQQAKRGPLVETKKATVAGVKIGDEEEEEQEGNLDKGIDTMEEDVTWVPPENQKGDGRTALNDKFGY